METKAVLERVAKDLTEIAQGKTWRVTGRAFTGRDGIAYSAGMSAPKSNVRVAKWTMASDLFTLETAKAFAAFVTSHDNGNALIGVMLDNAETVAKYNHEDRFRAFVALMAYAQSVKTIKPEKVSALIAESKTAKVATAKAEKVSDLSILGL